MASRAVFLDDSEDLQKLMALLLKAKFGMECLCFSNLSQLQSRREEVMDRDLAILDINLGPNQPSGLEAYRWLKDHDFKGKVVMLTGHAVTNPLVAAALQSGVEVFEKPLKAEVLMQALELAVER